MVLHVFEERDTIEGSPIRSIEDFVTNSVGQTIEDFVLIESR